MPEPYRRSAVSGIQRGKNMRIISLAENTEGKSNCQAEHGLCFYIETDRHKILMDTGQSDLFLRNAEKLGIDLTKVDTVVLSHGHYDHGGGLLPFAKVNPSARIYVHKDAFGAFYSRGGGEEIRYIGLDPEVRSIPSLVITGEKAEGAEEEGIYRIDEELSIFSGIGNRHPIPSANDRILAETEEGMVRDDFSHEQCLVVTEGTGSVLLSGCAHHGILNVLDRFRDLYHKNPDAVISGFHMNKKSGLYTGDDLCMFIDTALELKKTGTDFYTGHCTGKEPFEAMKKIMGDRLTYVHCGDEICFAGQTDGGEEQKKAEDAEKKRKSYMKNHKFWAWATVTCFLMTMWTGYKRK